jgi:mercuric ion transport protein
MRVIQLRQRRAVAAERSAAQAERGQAWLAAGGVLGAFASTSCCILPLMLFSLGVGGAWVANLTALASYQPIFVAITLGFLGAGFWLFYVRPKPACTDGEACARPLPGQIVKTSFWLATILVAAALAFPYIAPTLLGT